MKKLLSTLLLTGAIIGMSAIPVLAENFTYKVYNPRANKAYTAVLGTVTIADDGRYIWGFYKTNGEALCVLKLNTTNENAQGLVGGQCTDANVFMRFMNGEQVNVDKYNLGWREYSTGTFYREMNSIRRERSAQGKREFN